MKTLIPSKNLGQIESLILWGYIASKLGPSSHLKIQKLLYYIQWYHLAYFDKEIISDDFQASTPSLRDTPQEGNGEMGTSSCDIVHDNICSHITLSLLFLPPFWFRDSSTSGTVFARSLTTNFGFLREMWHIFEDFFVFGDEVGREGHG